MRVFFVGIHNKPNKPPLDSSTRSGKLIDKIIINLKEECIKTNLFDLNYIPKEEVEKYASSWVDKYKPSKEEIIVLLGSNVHKFFPKISSKIIKIKHPSSIWSKKSQENYIKDTLIKINET